jgi:hypothetical protein
MPAIIQQRRKGVNARQEKEACGLRYGGDPKAVAGGRIATASGLLIGLCAIIATSVKLRLFNFEQFPHIF